MKKLDFSKCTENYEVTELITQRVLSVDIENAVKDISKITLYQEETIRALYIAIGTGKNAILHGLAGFGKSTIVKIFCEYFGIPIHVITGYEDMEPEKLLGVPNFKELLENSNYVTAFDKSPFAKPGILILEEFLDVRPATAAALKDILTEKGMREKDNKLESLISSVVICTNKNPEDVAVDDSIAALYNDRFPIRHIVEWNDFSKEKYLTFIKFITKDKFNEQEVEFRVLSEMCSMSRSTTGIVSPRVVKDAIDVITTVGINYLLNLTGIDCTTLEKAIAESNKYKKSREETERLDSVFEYLKDLEIDLNNGYDPNKIEPVVLEVSDKLSEMFVFDSNYTQFIKVNTLCTTILENVMEKNSNKISKEDESYIKSLFSTK